MIKIGDDVITRASKKDFHMYSADPNVIHEYWIGSTALLKYATVAIRELQRYYTQHIEQHFLRGSILPTLDRREDFDVRPHRTK